MPSSSWDGTSYRQDFLFRLMESLLSHTGERKWEPHLDVIEELIITVGDNKRYESELETWYKRSSVEDKALIVDGPNKRWLRIRGVGTAPGSEPMTQTVIRGPHEGFNEDIQTNISLVRRRVGRKLPRVERKRIGRITRTTIAVMYINGIVNEKVTQRKSREPPG